MATSFFDRDLNLSIRGIDLSCKKRQSRPQYERVRVWVPVKASVPYVIKVPKHATTQEIKEELAKKDPGEYEPDNTPDFYELLGSNFRQFVDDVTVHDIEGMSMDLKEFKRKVLRHLHGSMEAREMTGEDLVGLYDSWQGSGMTFGQWKKHHFPTLPKK